MRHAWGHKLQRFRLEWSQLEKHLVRIEDNILFICRMHDALGDSGWIPSFWRDIGLSEFVDDNFERLGRRLEDK